MQLLYVRERIDYTVAHGDIQCLICFLPPDKGRIEAGRLTADRLYFVSDLMLQTVIGNLRKINKADAIAVVSNVNRQELLSQPQFPLCIGGMSDAPVSPACIKNIIGVLKKKNRIRVAILAGNDDQPDDADHLSVELDMLHRKLSAVSPCVEIDVYCHRLPRDFSAYLSVNAVTNIYQMPSGLNKLMQYDLYADLTGMNAITAFREGLAFFLEVMNMPVQAPEINPGPTEVILAGCSDPEDLVSVIIPTYNRSGFLKQAVESVLNQTYRNLELLIIDDGSTDDTRPVIEQYARRDLRVRYLEQENAGVPAARNRGISSSRGDYLLFLDDDDMLLPYAVQKMLSFLKQQGEDVKLVYGDAFFYHQDGGRKVLSDLPSIADRTGLYRQFLGGDPILSVFVMVEKNAVLEAGMFDPSFHYCQDYDLWMKILLRHRIAKLRIPVAIYRVHEAQRVKNRALVRFYSDCVALKLLQAIKPGDLFPEITGKKELADALEGLSRSVLGGKTAFPHFDTALELVRLAQKEHPTEKRQVHLENLEREIPVILKNNFQCELRASSPQH